MARYRKKPLVIEAIPVADLLIDHDVPEWASRALEDDVIRLLSAGVIVRTLEGDMMGGRLDMLARGVQGELYLIKPGIFRETYEPVEE